MADKQSDAGRADDYARRRSTSLLPALCEKNWKYILIIFFSLEEAKFIVSALSLKLSLTLKNRAGFLNSWLCDLFNRIMMRISLEI